MRALRVDKLTYAALEATLLEHAAGRAAGTVPVARMITTPVADLEAPSRSPPRTSPYAAKPRRVRAAHRGRHRRRQHAPASRCRVGR